MDVSRAGERIELFVKTAGLAAVLLPVAGFAIRWAAYWGHGSIPIEAALAASLPELAAQGAHALLGAWQVAAVFLAVWILEPAMIVGPDEQVPPEHLARFAGRVRVMDWFARLIPAALLSDRGWRQFRRAMNLAVLAVLGSWLVFVAAFPTSLIFFAAGAVAGALMAVLVKRHRRVTLAALMIPITAAMIGAAFGTGISPVRATPPDEVVFNATVDELESGPYLVLGRTGYSYYLLDCTKESTLEVAAAAIQHIAFRSGVGPFVPGPSMWDVLVNNAEPRIGLQVDCTP